MKTTINTCTMINTCIMITINNPSAAAMEYLAKLPSIVADIDAATGSTPVEDTGLTPAQVEAAQYDPKSTALRIVSVADIDNYLDVGSEVHWKGQKFEFDGVVERIETDDVADGEGWIKYDTKVLFIRRNDTDKLVSLNMRDIQTGRLTLVD